MARVEFLGWDRGPLDAAGDWIAERLEGWQGRIWVALPGARAGRILAERLARRVGPAAGRLRIVTVGALSDELLERDRPTASRLARTLAWERALRELEPSELERVLARAPRADGPARPWVRLAERVRELFGELGAEGLGFGDVAGCPALSAEVGERERWRVLERAEARMLEHVEAAGQADPHVARRRAIEARRLTATGRIVLVGAVELNELTRRMLALPGLEVDALVFAPAERRADFDELGCLRADRIVARGLARVPDWRVGEDPEGQAELVLDALTEWRGRFAAEQITIGVAGDEVTPYLRARLAAEGVRAREAAGRPFERTRPARLLRAWADFARDASAQAFGALVRHPDLEAVLAAETRCDAPAQFDDYCERHLPERVGEEWLGGARSAQLRAVGDALRRLLPTPRGERRAASAWSGAIRAAFAALYERVARPLDEAAARELEAALAELGGALDELEELPDPLDPSVELSDALDLVARALAGHALPPDPERSGEPTIELLGWLELFLDDAPALVVTDFVDGLVPESLAGDAFLPDSLRAALGLASNETRLARDLFGTELLANSRRAVTFVSGRKNRSQDPQLPSRILFHGAAAEVPGLVERFVHPPARPRRAQAASEGDARAARVRELPRRGAGLDPRTISVTAFKTWLESPYRYYLQQGLKLEALEPRRHELDPLHFGTFAHKLVETLGRDVDLRTCTDPARIEAFLIEQLEAQAPLRFGRDPLPAVALQLEQLRRRLAIFARAQARRTEEGWRIHAVEWTPHGGGCALDVDGRSIEVRGKIDRIDRHPDGRWAIWDYKSGDEVKDPTTAHRTKPRASKSAEADGEGDPVPEPAPVWKDLQLPLYRWMAAELGFEGLPTLGWISLDSSDTAERFRAVKGWDEAVLDEALEEARRVVRAIRAGELFDLGRWKPREPIFAAIGGVELVASVADSTDGADGDGGEEATR